MDIFIICNRGLERVCSQDVDFLINKKTDNFDGLCIVKDVSPKDIAILAYRLQSAFHIGVLLSTAKDFNNLQKDFGNNLDKKTWSDLISEGSSFAVRTTKIIPSEIPSPDLSAMFGETILNYSENNDLSLEVNLKNPTTEFLVFLTKDFCGVGVDVIGFDLSKRPYKLFNHSSALNGVFAHSIARYVGVKEDSKVLDPFCNNGTIPIEIALFQNKISPFVFERQFKGLKINILKEQFEEVEAEIKSTKISKKNIFAFDEQLKIIFSAKKNAKIAGILDAISFSKVSADWLDTKFEENELNIIISNPPKDSKRLNNPAKITKLYDELFYQSKFILKKGGLIALLVFHDAEVKKLAEKHDFKVIESKTIFSGQQENKLVICQK